MRVNATHAGIEASKLRCFPQPMVTSAFADDCGCTWAYAPTISGDRDKPFVLKVRYGRCLRH